MLTPLRAVAAIVVMALVTFLTRALPFLLFDRGEHPPKLVLYLGRVLPPAIIAMLIIYCLKDSLYRRRGNLAGLRPGDPGAVAPRPAGRGGGGPPPSLEAE